MDESVRRRIVEIIDGMSCPKGFRCAERGFSELCRAKDAGLESFLVCLEDGGESCGFRLGYGRGRYCSCPLRVYLARRLETDD
jgi:hypothetical protein